MKCGSPFILSSIMNRQILIILLFSVFIALLGIGIIVPVMPDFATRLGASGTSLGLMIAAFSLHFPTVGAARVFSSPVFSFMAW